MDDLPRSGALAAKVALLARVPILESLDGAAREEFANLARSVSMVARALVFAEGSTADAFFVVETGAVEIVLGSGPDERLLATLEPGSYFGEMGILERSKRQASARMARCGSLLRVDGADFLRFVFRHPTAEMKLRSGIVRRHTENIASIFKRER